MGNTILSTATVQIKDLVSLVSSLNNNTKVSGDLVEKLNDIVDKRRVDHVDAINGYLAEACYNFSSLAASASDIGVDFRLNQATDKDGKRTIFLYFGNEEMTMKLQARFLKKEDLEPGTQFVHKAACTPAFEKYAPKRGLGEPIGLSQILDLFSTAFKIQENTKFVKESIKNIMNVTLTVKTMIRMLDEAQQMNVWPIYKKEEWPVLDPTHMLTYDIVDNTPQSEVWFSFFYQQMVEPSSAAYTYG